MSQNTEKALDGIIDAIKTIVDNRMNEGAFDITKNAKITQVLGNNTYNILLDNNTYKKIKSNGDTSYNTNDIVKVMIPQNNPSMMFILGGGGSGTASVTAYGDLSGKPQINSITLNGGNNTITTANVPDSTDKRYITDAQVTKINNTIGTNTGDETATSLGSKIYNATEKSTPVDTDTIAISDSSASNVLKKLSWFNAKATLKTYLDTLYAAINHAHTVTNITDFDTEVSNNADVSANTSARHSHTNKAILDNTTASFTTAEQTKLSGIESGAEVNNISDVNVTDLTDAGDTNLHYHSSDRNRLNHTGTQLSSTISNFASTVRTTVLTGLSTATNAVVSATDTILVAMGKLQKQISDHISDVVSHITATERTNWNASYTNAHIHSNKTILDNTTASYTTLEQTKLSGIATNANNYSHPTQTAITSDNSNGVVIQDVLINTLGHTTSVSTIDLDSRYYTETEVNNLLNSKQSTSEKGLANGYASLDNAGKVPSTQLPSYVDDVLEYTNFASFPTTGESGKIYIALDTNKTYRWSGTAYVYITSGAVDSVDGKTGVVNLSSVYEPKNSNIQSHISSTSNPHNVTTAQIGAEPAFTKNTAFNKNFGTTAGTVAEGVHVGSTGSSHGVVTTSVNGFMSSIDKSKLDGIESGATGDMTATEILTAVKTVDGSGSGLDADLLDGQHGSFYSPINSPALTGTPTAPTAANGTNTTQIATTAFVQNAVGSSGGGDMLKSTYDPTNKNADAFNMDNMTSGTTNKVVTESEKTTWNSKENALPTGTTSQFLRGDKTFQAVTKTNVGLGSVQNYGIATQAEAEAGVSNVKYMTPIRVYQAIRKISFKTFTDSVEPTSANIGDIWNKIL